MEPRDNSDVRALEIATAVFHGHVETMDGDGNYTGVAHSGQRFSEALTARPYGFRSYAPVNTGLVLTRSQAGLLVLSQEGALPEGVTEPLSGEAKLYNSQGCQIHLDEDGNINITQKSGQYVNIGNNPTSFAARANVILADLENIQSVFDSHTHLTAPDGPVSTPSNLIESVDDPACTEVRIK